MILAKLLQSAPVIIMDGAMGTELMRRGIEPGGEANLERPDLVALIHRAYAEAGAKFLLTNTLTANRIAAAGRAGRLELDCINAAGVRLARENAGPDCVILGDIGSTGHLSDPSDSGWRDELFDAYSEQARVLASEGADGFMLETMCSLEEALLALRACKNVSDLPVLVSFAPKTAFGGGRTISGDSVADCARQVENEGGAAVGLNCGGVNPVEMAGIIAAMAGAAALPLLAKPNAGIPRASEKRFVYGLDETEFARGVMQCHHAGAKLVGGCCGTTPGHIRALAENLKD